MGYILAHRSIEFSRIDVTVYEQSKTRRRFFGRVLINWVNGEKSYRYYPSKEYLKEVKEHRFRSPGISKRLRINVGTTECMAEWEIYREVERRNNCVKLLTRISNKYKVPWNS